MEIAERFTVARPIDEVWNLLLDVPEVARCLPGAQMTADHGDGSYSGTLSVKLGPISSSFEGKASVVADEAKHEIRIDGKGVDRSGGSQGRVKVTAELAGIDDASTEVSLDSRLTLAGPIAQFGRTGLVKEVSRRLIDEFGACLHAKLEAGTVTEAAVIETGEIRGISLFFSSMWSWLVALFKRNPDAGQ